METTEQTITQPACFKCDDLGYTAGTEVFGVARCTCAIGVTLDMRATTGNPMYGVSQPSPTHRRLARAERALRRAGFQDLGGEDWKPPLGPAPHFITVREENIKPLLQRAYDLIDEARNAGQVLTIELVPLDPLAMGHYEMVADLRPKRERAEPLIGVDMAQDGTECTVESVRDNETGIVTITGVKYAPPQSGAEIEARCNAAPLTTMAFPERRTEARKVIWPDPSKMNFTTERRDPHSTLTQEQFDKRSTDKKRREQR